MPAPEHTRHLTVIHSQAINCLTMTPSVKIVTNLCLVRINRLEHMVAFNLAMTRTVATQPMYRMAAIQALSGKISVRELTGMAMTAHQTRNAGL
jgi:energy-converting hydrogenase Eha subunit H